MLELLPWLVAMFVLVVGSAFFSASEAALFSLKLADQRKLGSGSPPARAAAFLLNDPERLLSAILFWNLLINITFFAISSIATLQLERMVDGDPTWMVLFALGSLLTLIFFSEMVPKSLAVLRPLVFAVLVGYPLSVAVRVLDPVLPSMRFAMLLSQRLLVPNLGREQYLATADLHEAIKVSTNDSHLIEQEEAVLRNIVELSSIRVDEWMRPRSQFTAYSHPVKLSDLAGEMPDSGYLLITENDTDEIAKYVKLVDCWKLDSNFLDKEAKTVLVVPWSCDMAQIMEWMKRESREIAAVVNEFGETIGIVSFEDILDTLFSYAPSRSKRILNQNPVHPVRPGLWLVSGMTSLKRLAAELDQKLPKTHHVTVCGVVQEMVQRIAEKGDRCEWGPFHFRVLEVQQRGHMAVEVELRENHGASSP